MKNRNLPILTASLLSLTATAKGQWTNVSNVNTPLTNTAQGSATSHALVRSGTGCVYLFIDGGGNLRAQALAGGSGSQLQGASGAALESSSVIQVDAASDASGGAFAAFVKDGDVFAHRVDASGATVWGSATTLCSLPSQSSAIDIIDDGGGGAIVSWREVVSSTTEQIRVQHIDASGTAGWTSQGVVVSSGTPGIKRWRAQVASDGSGGAFVAWVQEQYGQQLPMTRRVDGSGTPVFAEVPVTVNAAVTERLWLKVVSDGAGGALFGLYHWPYSGASKLITQRVDAAGNQQWPLGPIKSGVVTFDNSNGQIGIETGLGIEVQSFAIASDGAAGVIAVMNRSGSGFTDMPIMGQCVDGALATPLLWGGNTVATPVLISASRANFEPKIQTAGANAVVTWTSFANSKYSNGADIHAQRIAVSNGARTWGTSSSDLVVANAVQFQGSPLIVPRTGCQWTIAFFDNRGGSYPPSSYVQIVRHHASYGGKLGDGVCFGFELVSAAAASHLVNFHPGGIIFTANDGVIGEELYFTDTTPNGTVLIADLNKGGSSSPQDFAQLGNTMFFSADDGKLGRELYAANRQRAWLVADIRQGRDSSTPRDLVVAGDFLYFTADDGRRGRELWRTDGTARGTVLVVDLENGKDGSNPTELIAMGSALAFAATTIKNGTELYTMAKGSNPLLHDLARNQASSRPCCLTAVAGDVFFAAHDAKTGVELYRTKGGVPQLLSDINPGTLSSSPRDLTAVDGRLFFTATASQGREVYMTDGTANGTAILADIRRGRASSKPGKLTGLRGRLYFTANDGTNGDELYATNGTAAGTLRLSDVRPGTGSTSIDNLTAVGSRHVFFSADDGENGEELWMTDGTAGGTRLAKDIVVGRTGSNPRELTVAAGSLVLVTSDPTGDQILALDPGALAHTFGASCGSTSPSLAATDPVLGDRFTLSGENAATPTAMTMFGFPAPISMPLLGCYIHIDLSYSTVPMFVPVQGTRWSATLPIPADPRMAGARLAVQTFYVGPTRIAASNACLLTLGY